MFINFTNHPSAQWSDAQKDAALIYGEIADIPFPSVPAYAPSEDLDALAEDCVARILEANPAVVMCQGEFTLAFSVASKLKARGVKVIAACSDRKTVEIMENGATRKTVVFEFGQFREYSS